MSVGDRVRVTLRADSGSRELPMPSALAQALKDSGEAKAAWERLAPSRRREILAYLNFLKTPAALNRNVDKTVAGLVGSGNGKVGKEPV